MDESGKSECLRWMEIVDINVVAVIVVWAIWPCIRWLVDPDLYMDSLGYRYVAHNLTE